MRGQVLAWDYRTGIGEISGDDGQRYGFAVAEWKADAPPQPRQIVDFEITDGLAMAIYSLSAPRSAEVSRVVAALLAIFLGTLGIHKFYMGRKKAGVAMLLISLVGLPFAAIPTFVVAVIGLIEGIVYFAATDDEFYERYVADRQDIL